MPGLGNIVVYCSVGPIITVHGQITAREYVDSRLGNQVHPMIQASFPNDAVIQGDGAPIHIAVVFGHHI
jgi:hypothetical protein